jgi:endonuclease I/chitodextrinase
MKKLLFCAMLLFALTVSAQIPTYYNDVNLTLTGTALKTELATKITNTHTNALSYDDIWDALIVTDLNPDDSMEVLLMYGYEDGSDGDPDNDRERSTSSMCGAGSCLGLWNREHVYANSLATPDLDDMGTSGAPYADAHNLRPCDSPTNSSRGNKLFADGSGNAGAVTGGWYPGDEWKGDVARIAMYMYLRYDSQCLPTNLGVGDSSGTPDDMIDLFLQWNVEDPVSDFEKQRNTYHDSAGTYAQGNRNPFIDNPAFATEIWGGPQAEDIFGGSVDSEAPTVPTNVASSNITGTSFSLSWTASTDNAVVTGYNILLNGVQTSTSTTNSYDASSLSVSTPYAVTIQAYDAQGNTSDSSTILIVTTGADGGATASDLFFSEYIEGSSNNKALEVSNYTGSTVDLTVYSLKKQTNGAGSWSSGLSLTGTLANGNVFVVANSSAISDITDKADITTGGTQVTFNGNDPVGLFKNDVLIDIIGTFDGGTSNFAQNVTLQRKASVTSPNTTYTASEWESLATDTFTDIGSHLVSSINSFTGTTDSDWDTASNWSFKEVPTSADVIIKSGVTVSASASISVDDLTLETGAALTVTSNLTNTGNITLGSGSSLIAQNSTSFDLTYNRYLETTNWYLVSSTVTNEALEDIISGHSFATGTGGNIGIGDYDNTVPGWTYANVSTTGTLASGEGRTFKMAGTGNISFSGAMPLDSQSITISDGGASGNAFNLIGNPFPSYIPVNNVSPLASNSILRANTAILDEETIWFWDQANSQYIQVNQSSAIISGTRYIAPGQGFFVKSTTVGGSFTFSEDLQSHQSTEVFNRSSNTDFTHLKLILSNTTTEKNTDVLYIGSASCGWDNGFDATMFQGSSGSFAIYTQLVEDNQGEDLGIQALSNTNFDKVIPLGVNASSGTEITISAEITNLPSGYTLFLEDRSNDTFTELDEASSFTQTLSADISGIGRFYLHTINSSLGVDSDILQSVHVYTNNDKELHLVGLPNEKVDVTIYDISGREVLTTSYDNGGNETIDIAVLSQGMFIVNLQSLSGRLNKKVLIK